MTDLQAMRRKLAGVVAEAIRRSPYRDGRPGGEANQVHYDQGEPLTPSSEEGQEGLLFGESNDSDQGDGNVQLSARESGNRDRSVEGRGNQPRAEVNSARRGFNALGVGEKIKGGSDSPRISYDGNGNVVLIIHRDHFTDSEGVADQIGYESGKFTQVILGEELLHAAHVISVRNEWEAGGRKGSFSAYLRNDSHSVFQDIRDTIAKVSESERQQLLEAIRASYHVYTSRLTRGVTTHVDLETILDDVATKGDPVKFVAELLRQAAQIRKIGSLSEEVHADLSDTPDPGPIDGLVQRLAMWVRDAIWKMKATLPGVADGRFGRRAQDRLAKMEAVAAIANKAMEKDASHSKFDPKEQSATNNDKEVGKDRSLDSNQGLEQQIFSESPSSTGAPAEDATSGDTDVPSEIAPPKLKPAPVVPTKDGHVPPTDLTAESYDFIESSPGQAGWGGISPEMVLQAKEGLLPGEIRIQQGVHFSDGTGFGWIHAHDHEKGIRRAGWTSVKDFLAETLSGFDEIWRQPNGRLLLVRRGASTSGTLAQPTGKLPDVPTAVVELQPTGSFYGLTTAFLERGKKDLAKKNTLVWERSEPATAKPGKLSTP